MSSNLTPIYRFAVLVTLSALLTACGFQLRQAQPLPESLSPLRLEMADPYSLLGENLGEALRDAGLVISADPTATSVARLRVSQDQIGLVPLTIGVSGRVQEYALRYQVTLSLTDANGVVVLPRQQVELSRDYAFDTAQSLGSPGEEEVVREELQRDMVRALMRRIEAAVRQQP